MSCQTDKTNRNGWPCILACLLLAAGSAGSAETPAFPGAEGFGAYAKGGRGDQVLFVTNLDDYIPRKEKPVPGSLRHACETKGPRTIISKDRVTSMPLRSFVVAGSEGLRNCQRDR